jgi:hypothetical protein
MLDLNKSTSNFLEKGYDVISIVILLVDSQRSLTPRGDIKHSGVEGINPQGISGGNMKNR